MRPRPPHFSFFSLRVGAGRRDAAQSAIVGCGRTSLGSRFHLFRPVGARPTYRLEKRRCPVLHRPRRLSPTVTQAQANAMVAAAAAQWSSIPTAALQINAAGSLAEDVNGANFYVGPNGLIMPPMSKVPPPKLPLGVIYDADGSVLDALEGEGASDPDSVQHQRRNHACG
jgi:hypothetical protein